MIASIACSGKGGMFKLDAIMVLATKRMGAPDLFSQQSKENIRQEEEGLPRLHVQTPLLPHDALDALARLVREHWLAPEERGHCGRSFCLRNSF